MKHSLLLLVAATGLLISCSKNKNDSPVNPSTGSFRIKTYSSDNGTSNYTYDSKGRLISRVYPDGAKSEFDYSNPNKIINNYYFPDGSLEGTGEYDLNAAGLIVKKVYSDGPANVYTFEYDASKNIIKEIHDVNGNVSVLDYFYTNGSMDSVRYKWNGNLHYTVIYSYYTDKANVLDNDAWGQEYEGHYGKYLLKKEETRYADGSPSSIWEQSYEFDPKGRVSKRTAQKESNTEVSYYTYY
jgi:YD repeat-containing protein